MYILEIQGKDNRDNAILNIVNTIYNEAFEELQHSFIIPGFTYLEKSIETKTEKIGIKDVKEFKKSLWIKADNTKVAIINNAHNLTIESQNALLKDLEEEPENSIIILALDDIRLVLPTIKSRGIHIKKGQMHIIHPSLKEEKVPQMVYNNEDKDFDENFFDDFLNLPIYNQLIYAKGLEGRKSADKENISKVTEKIDQVESFLHNLLSYYEKSITKDGVLGKVQLVESGLEKIKRGVKSSTVLEYILLKLKNG